MSTGPFPIKQSHFPRKNDRKTKYVFRFSTNWRTMDYVTSVMHKFTIKLENNRNISICGLDTNIKSPCIMCVQYIGGVHYIGGIS